MLSSISSSERNGRQWLLAWVFAVLAAGVALASAELYWRSRGYVPVILDSRQLWSLQRDRVDHGKGRALVLLGASRTVYGINPKRLRQRLPRYRPVMLAISGHYPLATLRDLADDEHFNGVVLCDIDAMGLMRANWDRQQTYVDYYHRQWSPSWRIHRIVLTSWQRHAVIANPDMGWRASLRYAFEGGKPFRTYATLNANRSGDVDFRRSNPGKIKRHFAAVVNERIAEFPETTPRKWLEQLQPVAHWVRQIQARGGEVIFYKSPTHGLQRQSMNTVLPDEEYWDQARTVVPAHFLDALDVPRIARIPEPDNAHFDYRDKARYTDALVQALVQRGWLKK
ncbi:MAG: hypothetical protein WBW92_00195 [Rhodanobacteraceae bacterium]